jgi:hypothetical protein
VINAGTEIHRPLLSIRTGSVIAMVEKWNKVQRQQFKVMTDDEKFAEINGQSKINGYLSEDSTIRSNMRREASRQTSG